MRSAAKTGNSVTFASLGNCDLSQFRDSLEASALILHLEPMFPSSLILIPGKNSDLERRRKQKDAAALMSSIRSVLNEFDEPWNLALILTNYDLFSNGRDFVFGNANAAEGIALLSTARLGFSDEDRTRPAVIKERILKEAAHEVGHLGMLPNCENASCIMAEATRLDQVDAKLPRLCDRCRRLARI
jgi:archaemetzincin